MAELFQNMHNFSQQMYHHPKSSALLTGAMTIEPPWQTYSNPCRFLIYYIRTADKLMRTARWIEQLDGGLERLRKIIVEDELGICAELDKQMDDLVGTYYDEWKAVVDDPERRKQFRQFVNTVCIPISIWLISVDSPWCRTSVDPKSSKSPSVARTGLPTGQSRSHL